MSFLAQLVERVTSICSFCKEPNDEVSRSSRLEGIFFFENTGGCKLDLGEITFSYLKFTFLSYLQVLREFLCNFVNHNVYSWSCFSFRLITNMSAIAAMETDELPVVLPSSTVSGLSLSLHPLPILNISEHLTRLKLQKNSNSPLGTQVLGYRKIKL